MKLPTSFLALMIAGSAYARSADGGREGFNFGVDIRAIGDTNNSSLDQSVTKDSSSRVVNPYVGYSTGIFNLGIGGLLESDASTVTTTDSKITTDTQKANYNSMYMFGRLLFGYVFYLEGGAGVSQGKISEDTQVMQGDASFSGSTTHNSYSGVGYMYQAGGGVELPIKAGFYINSAIYYRSLQLKDYTSKEKQITISDSKSELMFGISHYLK